MKPRLSPFDIEGGCFSQSYTARLFDETILEMIKKGIPLTKYEEFAEAKFRKEEEEKAEEEKLKPQKKKAQNVKALRKKKAQHPKVSNPAKETSSNRRKSQPKPNTGEKDAPVQRRGRKKQLQHDTSR
jgi:hypothetical protein